MICTKSQWVGSRGQEAGIVKINKILKKKMRTEKRPFNNSVGSGNTSESLSRVIESECTGFKIEPGWQRDGEECRAMHW